MGIVYLIRFRDSGLTYTTNRKNVLRLLKSDPALESSSLAESPQCIINAFCLQHFGKVIANREWAIKRIWVNAILNRMRKVTPLLFRRPLLWLKIKRRLWAMGQ